MRGQVLGRSMGSRRIFRSAVSGLLYTDSSSDREVETVELYSEQQENIDFEGLRLSTSSVISTYLSLSTALRQHITLSIPLAPRLYLDFRQSFATASASIDMNFRSSFIFRSDKSSWPVYLFARIQLSNVSPCGLTERIHSISRLIISSRHKLQNALCRIQYESYAT